MCFTGNLDAVAGLLEPPSDLSLVQSFINTADLEAGLDSIGRPAELTSWLRTQDLLKRGVKLGRADGKRALELRAALRDLAGANSGQAVSPRSLAVLDHEAARASLGRLFGRQQLPDTWSAVAGRFLLAVVRAQSDGTWNRLKTCSNDACGWAFYDRSRNRSGQWCAMSICGSRFKMRAYRGRHASIESGAR